MNITINIVELASELAEKHLFDNFEHDIKIYEENEEETKYTDEAQEIFNELYDSYYSIIENTKI
jgi:hypothetical protein